MGRTVKKLSGLEIDEVSLVDRPANQHGLVAIAKREDRAMPVFDVEGDEVFEEELEHGDVVYDENGTELTFVEDGMEPEYEPEYEPEMVGKYDTVAAARAAGAAMKGQSRGGAEQFYRKANIGARKAVRGTGKHVRDNSTAYAGAGGAAGGLGAGYALGKSLGDEVLEELSKSLTDSDRDEVIAKAMDYVDTISRRSDELEEMVEQLQAERDLEDYTELAKNYELPIAPDDIGGIMYRAAQVMPQEDVAQLDRLLSSVGEISKAGFEQLGYDGGGYSDVLEQVYAVAGEAVAKSDSDISQEMAVTAMFAANPSAYDEYEADQRNYR